MKSLFKCFWPEALLVVLLLVSVGLAFTWHWFTSSSLRGAFCMCILIGDLDLPLWDALWFTINRADTSAWWYGIADTAATLATMVLIVYAIIRSRTVIEWVHNKMLENTGTNAPNSQH